MKTYFYDVSPFDLRPDLDNFVRELIADLGSFLALRPLAELRLLDNRILDVSPGKAWYFLGGRNSIADAFRGHVGTRFRTTNGVGLSLTYVSKITAKTGKRVSSAFRSAFKIHKARTMVGKQAEDEYNEFRRKSISCLCIYNNDTLGRRRPPGSTDQMIPDTISLDEVATRFCRMFIGDRQDDRMQAVDNLFDQLNM